jgi:phage baseplate assembly protein W
LLVHTIADKGIKMSVYKDPGFEFEKTSQTGINQKEDIDSINQSIRNILFTMQGEVPFDPLFGSGIHQLLFEKMSPVTEQLLKDEVQIALENHEPRIEINNIELFPDYDNNLYELDLEYKVVYLDVEETVQIDIQLQGV